MRPAAPGRLITGRYRLGSVIGHGGMGVVWRARDELLGREVAVKELIWPADLTEQDRQTACRRTVREAQTAARLAHPNVIRVYDIVEEDDGHPWVVMELLPFRSLRDIVHEDGPLAPARVARIGLGILAGLRAAHAEGIMHRDVTPANILVGPDDRAVLTDFGIARVAGSPTLTNVGAVVGSPSYIAPERARGEPSGAPADLWGLGASLYAAVEGRPPFEGANALATLTAVVADEPEPAGHAGPLRPAIGALLSKDPAARPDAAEAERMLSRVARGQDILAAAGPRGPAPVPPGSGAPPAGPAGRAPSRRARSRASLAGFAGLAGIAAAGVAVAFVMTGSASSGQHAAAPPAASRASAAADPGATRAHASPARPASPGGRPSPAGASPPGGAATPAGASPPPAAGSQPGGSAGPGALPAGFVRFTNSTGFSIGVPDGWQISHVGHYVYVTDPSDSGIFLLIDQSDQPKRNALADWRQQAANRAGGYPDYHLIRLDSVRYPQAEQAADWEFSYDRDGVLVRILNRNVLANARHAYALYWSVPEAEWNAYYHYFQAFAATFRPAP